MFETPLQQGKTPVSFTPLQIRQLTAAWLVDAEYRRLSLQTIAFRRNLAEKLIWFIEHRALSKFSTLEARQFLMYLDTGHQESSGRWGNHNLKQTVRPATLRTYYNNLKVMFSWVVSEGYADASPMATVKPPVYRPDQIQPFSEEQVVALLDAAKRSRHGLRDYGLLLFLLDTGVRASELCSLSLSKVDIINRKAIVLGKGDKSRAVFFSKVTAKALMAYLKGRQDIEGPLFKSERGTALTRSGLLQIMERLGKDANIEATRCSPHTWRHTAAIFFLRSGGHVFGLREMLGHVKIEQTARYSAIAVADVQEQHRQFSPVDRIKGRGPGSKSSG